MENRQKPMTSKIILIVIIVIIIIVFGYLGYLIWKSENRQSPQATSSPSSESSTSPNISPKFSSSISPSPAISPTTSPTSETSYQIPQGETYEISSKADTNGDGKEEILVITKKANGKYHAYVLSADGAKLFDNQDLGQKPVRIAIQTYNEGEKYVSWMLVFTEQSGSLAFIHWNGQKYEIPQDNLGI